jgi:GxxExxY protein
LCDQVRQTAYDIHLYHGHGHLEKVYENALIHRLRKAGLDVKQQYPLTVYDEDGTIVGDYFSDLLVEDMLVVELKTAKALVAVHELLIYGSKARGQAHAESDLDVLLIVKFLGGGALPEY